MNREGDWMCNSCQHLNFKKRDSCQRCRCPKFGCANDMSQYVMNKTDAIMAGDWYCNVINCGAHNYASRTSCYRCGTIKEDFFAYGGALVANDGYMYDADVLPGFKSGDWICNRLGCGVHNYACRMECFKCRNPKDFGGAV